jgi:hypothetical protein
MDRLKGTGERGTALLLDSGDDPAGPVGRGSDGGPDTGRGNRGGAARGGLPLLANGLLLLALGAWLALLKHASFIAWVPAVVAGVGFVAAWLWYCKNGRG